MLAIVMAPSVPPPWFDAVTDWRGGNVCDPETPAKASDLGDSEITGGLGSKRAVTVTAWFIVAEQAADPLHQPPHAPNWSLPIGVAVSSTTSPGLNTPLHVGPSSCPPLIVQLMRGGDDVIVPLPAPPPLAMVSTGSA